MTLAKNEGIKAASDGLRGTIAGGLARHETGAIAEDDQQLVKFHGMYQQDDRDLRPERLKKGMEAAYSFMLRLRIPGGVMTPAQWLRLDALARDWGDGTMRLTTRQTFQFHGVIKANLKATMRAIDAAALDTLAACGDVNRNVMASTDPALGPLHAAAYGLASALSTRLLPQTGAYREIWLDGEKVAGGEAEPVYGPTYLPRKFKAVVAVPPSNEVDVFAHDLGFIAIADAAGALAGWNVTVGGGMGMTHGEPATFPRAADVMGFCTPGDALGVAEAVVTTQRDWGDRSDRRHARLKYTIETHGLAAFRAEVERRARVVLEAPRAFAFDGNGDRFGWTIGPDGRHHLTLFVENGRIADRGTWRLKSALAALAGWHPGEFRCTANQNLVVAGVDGDRRADVEALFAEHGVALTAGALRRNAMACVALPTCGLALAEAERYLPTLIGEIEAVAARHGLANDAITVRMTGCPNGCARPFLAEIGLVGRGPGRYNLYLGGAFDGTRLNKLWVDNIAGDTVAARLDPVIAEYAADRAPGESFGDFVVRAGHVAASHAGRDFHADTGALR